MSNKLHDFDDNNVKGRAPITKQINAIKEEWKKVHTNIIQVEKTGNYQIEDEKPKIITPVVAQLKVTLQEINPNISKLKKKLANDPNNKKRAEWEENLGRLQIQKMAILKSIEQA